MIYVFISVCCSIIVAVLIKLARRRNINVQQLVLWNYPCTVLMTYLLLDPQLQILSHAHLPIGLYIPLIILLPTLFIFIALAIKFSGIVKTDVAQRMSLFIPLLASFILFGEVASSHTLLGVMLGLVAVFLSISWKSDKANTKKQGFIYPIIVFLGMGVIDILFKQITQHKEIPYITSMFIVFTGAMIFGGLILLWKIFIKGEVFSRAAVGWGSFLGVFNFANIYFYMKAHRALPENPSIVFTTMNIGVIVLGSIIGVLLFKEKLSKLNYIGLILAVVSIFLIAYL